MTGDPKLPDVPGEVLWRSKDSMDLVVHGEPVSSLVAVSRTKGAVLPFVLTGQFWTALYPYSAPGSEILTAWALHERERAELAESSLAAHQILRETSNATIEELEAALEAVQRAAKEYAAEGVTKGPAPLLKAALSTIRDERVEWCAGCAPGCADYPLCKLGR